MVVNFGSTTETFHVGMGSIAVPGIIAGIYYIHENFATLPMSVLVEPALDLARNGVVINDFQFFDIRVLEAIMTKEEEARNIFYPTGSPIPVGSVLKMPAMADYLEFLVKEGKQEFYLTDRQSGAPLANVKAEFYVSTYNSLLRRYETVKSGTAESDKNGYFQTSNFKTKNSYYNNSFLVKLTNKDDELFLDDSYYNYGTSKSYEQKFTTFFLDRAIYRPGQTVYFKGLV